MEFTKGNTAQPVDLTRSSFLCKESSPFLARPQKWPVPNLATGKRVSNVAILGFATVGRPVGRILAERAPGYLRLTHVCNRKRGVVNSAVGRAMDAGLQPRFVLGSERWSRS